MYIVSSYKYKILILALCMLAFGCSSDDSDPDSQIFRNLQGTVLGVFSCNTESNGLAYLIKVDDFELTEFIISGSLPEKFKIEQLRIKFDMRQSSEEITICTLDVSSELFYVLSNISTIEN